MRDDVQYKPLILISIIALGLGYWFAANQLYVISPDASQSYPTFYFSVTIAKCYLTILTLYLMSQLVLSQLSDGKCNPLHTGLTYVPLLAVYAHCALAVIVTVIVVAQLCLLISVLRKGDCQRLAYLYSTDIMAFAGLLILHGVLTSQFSPLHWSMSLLSGPGLVTEEIPVVSPLFKGYALAKQYAFSWMDYSEWAGILHPPITLSSPLLQFLTFIFDLPSVSPEFFHRVLAAIYFVMVVAGSFGFYLFLKYAAKVYPLFAFFGGCLFFFSGAPHMSSMFVVDGGVFMSSYAVFPFALLLISLAFEKQSYYVGALGGAALASQFFLMAPHPEATLYAFFFYGLYALGLCLFSANIIFRQRMLLTLCSFLTFFALSAFTIVPIIYDEITGQMHTFAHTGDVVANTWTTFMPYLHLLVLFAPVSLLFLGFQKRLSPVHKSALFLSLVILFLINITTHLGLLKHTFRVLHLSLHVWSPWRIGMYFCLSTFVVAMIALDGMTRTCCRLISKQFRYTLSEPIV